MLTGAIILAAGGSSRMGKPKQLLQVEGESLLQRTIREMLKAGLDRTVVVLGANSAACAETIRDLPMTLVINHWWLEGIASSLRLGLDKLRAVEPACQSVVIALCDQVNFTAEVVRGLVAARDATGKGIIASEYSGELGAPAVFSSAYFSQLAHLKGDAGARNLFRGAGDDLASVPFPGGEVDFDTKSDYEAWLHRAPAPSG